MYMRRTARASSLFLSAVTVTVIAVTIAVIAATAGCSPVSPAPTDAVPSTAATPNADMDATLWSIASTGEQLPMDDVDVQALQKVVALHSGASDNRSPETVEASVAQELSFFSPLFIEKLNGDKYRDALIAMYVDNDLTVEQTGVGWMRSTIDAGRNNATVGFESHMRIVGASEGYLHHLGVAAGDEVAQPRQYTLTRVDGTWVIDDIAKGPLRPLSMPTP